MVHTRRLVAVVPVCLALLLAGCAAEVPVAPAQLQPLQAARPNIRVATDTAIHLPTGRSRLLPAGSAWQAAGTLPQGVVYRPVGTVFMIVGRNVHEAYLVLQGSSLQGFYLPGEGNYSPLPTPVSLPLSGGGQQ